MSLLKAYGKTVTVGTGGNLINFSGQPITIQRYGYNADTLQMNETLMNEARTKTNASIPLSDDVHVAYEACDGRDIAAEDTGLPEIVTVVNNGSVAVRAITNGTIAELAAAVTAGTCIVIPAGELFTFDAKTLGHAGGIASLVLSTASSTASCAITAK